MIAGAHRYARSLGFVGASEEVNSFEKIFGLNVTPRPDGTEGVRLISTPSVLAGGALGALIGSRLGVGGGKSFVASGAVGAAVGMLMVGVFGAARMKGW